MKRDIYRLDLRDKNSYGVSEYDYGFIVVDNNKKILERRRPLFSNFDQQFIRKSWCGREIDPEDFKDEKFSETISYKEFGESNIGLSFDGEQMEIYLKDFTGYISVRCAMISNSEQTNICEKIKFEISKDGTNLIVEFPFWDKNGIYDVSLFPNENEVWKYYTKPQWPNILNILCNDHDKVVSLPGSV